MSVAARHRTRRVDDPSRWPVVVTRGTGVRTERFLERYSHRAKLRTQQRYVFSLASPLRKRFYTRCTKQTQPFWARFEVRLAVRLLFGVPARRFESMTRSACGANHASFTSTPIRGSRRAGALRADRVAPRRALPNCPWALSKRWWLPVSRIRRPWSSRPTGASSWPSRAASCA